jgi:predicted phage terminase large subunit-like protein
MFKGFDRAEKLQKKWGKPRGSVAAVPDRWTGTVGETYKRLHPKYLDTPHLAPVRELFERAKRGDRVRACVSMPPRWSKTEMLLAGMVDRLRTDPGSRVGYASYSARLAEKKSSLARTMAIRDGVPIDPTSRSKKDWRTGVGEGGVWATSVGGSINGEGFELLLPDDLLSGRLDAESPLIRDQTFDWLKADVTTRMEPEGSIIVGGTRWHVDDPIGRLSNEGWELIVVPALNEAGQSNWPERWPTARLLEIRQELGGEDGYDWCSLYMGNPRALGDMVFRDAHLVESMAGSAPRIAIGVDFAYTMGKSSDRSCAVVLAEWMGKYTVIDVLLGKWPEAEFREKVWALYEQWDAQFVTGYIAATEQPNIDLLATKVPAFGRRAVADKKTRALPTAAGWNTGRIEVLGGQSWTKGFVSEVVGFTGGDSHDDQVDALVAVYESMHAAGEIDWKFMGDMQAAVPQAIDWVN